MALKEDACRIRTGQAPQNLAALRNGILSWLRLAGHTNITAALRVYARQTQHLLTDFGILKK